VNGIRFLYAPDGAAGGSNGPMNTVEDTLPDERYETGAVEDYGDYDLVDDNTGQMPADLANKTPAELAAEIARRDNEARELGARVDPTNALSAQFKEFLALQQPKAAPIPEGYKLKGSAPQQMDPVARAAHNKRLAERFLDDPAGATQEVLNAEMAPVMMQFAQNLALQSRELVRLDPDTKDIYRKYASEIEADVAEATVADKLSNPRIYHAAVERAKSRHFTELVDETTQSQQEAIAAKYFGIDVEALRKLKDAPGAPVKPAAAASSTLAGAAGNRPPVVATQRKTIAVNPQQRARIEQGARALGVTASEYATYLRERGEL